VLEGSSVSTKYVVTIEGLGGVHEDVDVPGEWLPEVDDTGCLYFVAKGRSMRAFNSNVWREYRRVELVTAVEQTQ
jgi:hypothetical protein